MELVDFIEKFAEQFDDVDVEQLSSTTGCSIDYYND